MAKMVKRNNSKYVSKPVQTRFRYVSIVALTFHRGASGASRGAGRTVTDAKIGNPVAPTNPVGVLVGRSFGGAQDAVGVKKATRCAAKGVTEPCGKP